jgi:hypothetical protein
VGREHVVAGGDDRQIGALAVAQRLLVAGGAGGEAVGEVGAAQTLARRLAGDGGVDPVEIGAPRRAAIRSVTSPTRALRSVMRDSFFRPARGGASDPATPPGS